MSPAIAVTRTPLVDLHNRFAPVLPAVEAAGTTAFQGLRSPEDREDALADAMLAAWRRFLRAITERAAIDPGDLARRAVAAVVRRLHRNTMLPA